MAVDDTGAMHVWGMTGAVIGEPEGAGGEGSSAVEVAGVDPTAAAAFAAATNKLAAAVEGSSPGWSAASSATQLAPVTPSVMTPRGQRGGDSPRGGGAGGGGSGGGGVSSAFALMGWGSGGEGAEGGGSGGGGNAVDSYSQRRRVTAALSPDGRVMLCGSGGPSTGVAHWELKDTDAAAGKDKVGRCRFTLSSPVSKAPKVSAIEATM